MVCRNRHRIVREARQRRGRDEREGRGLRTLSRGSHQVSLVFFFRAPRASLRVCAVRPRSAHTHTHSMAAALAAAGMPLAAAAGVDAAFDEEVDAALLAAGVGGSGGALADHLPAAHTQATAGSAAPLAPAAAPPPPHAARAVLPPPPAALPHSFSLDRPVQFDGPALARARERKGPLLLAMMAEHARRGVRCVCCGERERERESVGREESGRAWAFKRRWRPTRRRENS